MKIVFAFTLFLSVFTFTFTPLLLAAGDIRRCDNGKVFDPVHRPFDPCGKFSDLKAEKVQSEGNSIKIAKSELNDCRPIKSHWDAGLDVLADVIEIGKVQQYKTQKLAIIKAIYCEDQSQISSNEFAEMVQLLSDSQKALFHVTKFMPEGIAWDKLHDANIAEMLIDRIVLGTQGPREIHQALDKLSKLVSLGIVLPRKVRNNQLTPISVALRYAQVSDNAIELFELLKDFGFNIQPGEVSLRTAFARSSDRLFNYFIQMPQMISYIQSEEPIIHKNPIFQAARLATTKQLKRLFALGMAQTDFSKLFIRKNLCEIIPTVGNFKFIVENIVPLSEINLSNCLAARSSGSFQNLNGQLLILQYLIKRGTDLNINMHRFMGRTPLMTFAVSWAQNSKYGYIQDPDANKKFLKEFERTLALAKNYGVDLLMHSYFPENPALDNMSLLELINSEKAEFAKIHARFSQSGTKAMEFQIENTATIVDMYTQLAKYVEDLVSN